MIKRKMQMIWTLSTAGMALAVSASVSSAQTPLGSGFTYQGKLNLSGSVLNDTADFQFSLWDADTAGNMIGSTVTIDNVMVVDGLFTVEIDFGVLAFNGDNRWLEIDVRSPTGTGVYTTLSPRQPLTAAPYAQTAVEALNVSGIDGHSLDAADGSLIDAVFVDNVGNVGVGTTTPAGKLDVAGTIQSSSGGFIFPDNTIQTTAATGGLWSVSGQDIYYNGGSVGIGTSTPLAGVDVNTFALEGFLSNALKLKTTGGLTHVRFGRLGTGIDEGFTITKNYIRPSGFETEDPNTGSQFIDFVADGGLSFATAPAGSLPAPRMLINEDGNIGIGTTAPAYPLHVNDNGTAVDSYPGAGATEKAQVQMLVNGTGVTGGGLAISDNGGFFDLNDGYITYLPLATGQGMRVQGSFRVVNSAWPDYVFEEDYDLKSLAEVERHIQTHGHLPDVPSAAEIHADGVDVSEMNAVLLRKIEELTLHMIDMQKEIDRLKTGERGN